MNHACVLVMLLLAVAAVARPEEVSSEAAGPALPPAPVLAAPPVVRVWLSDAPAEPVLSCAEGVFVRPLAGDQPVLLPRLAGRRISWNERGIYFGEVLYSGDGIDFEPQGSAPIQIDGVAYAGSLRVMRAGGRLACIVRTDLEQYAMCVVRGEMPSRWPQEALKAQAVAARTYALYRVLLRTDSQWDLMSTVEDQLFGGGAVPQRVRDAVNATRGEVLSHNGGIFPAYYHSACGGETESPSRALGRPGFEFLEGVPCPYCAASGYGAWSTYLSAEDLEKRLRAAGCEVGQPITGCVVVEPDATTGRSVRIEWPGGQMVLNVAEFRRIVGRGTIRSGRFEVQPGQGGWIIRGRGLGHGVGMCQHGAREMALLGKSYREILSYYYRNTDLLRLY